MATPATVTGAKVNVFEKIKRYLKDVKIELKKVVWPTRPQLINYTITVLVFCVIIGGVIFLLDLPMQEFLKFITTSAK